MKLKCLGCDALARIVYLCAAQSPHIVDVELFQLGLHNDPAGLRARLQEQIDATTGQDYDALVLAYGLCGQSTHGLIAKDIPLVIPRAHDCITLFLGDRERYNREFRENPGTYWYALDYIERKDSAGNTFALGSNMETDINAVYEEYVEKYGEDNANYLMEVMGAWKSHYKRAVYIDMGVGDGTAIEAETQAEADRRGWSFERVAGDIILIRRLLAGDWERDFLVLEPGEQITMTYDSHIVGCLKQDQTSS